MTPRGSPVASGGAITSHVLDVALGQPARGVAVRLDIQDDRGQWNRLADRLTDDDGRVGDLLAGRSLERRPYRLTFATGAYFERDGRATFYPVIEVVFEIRDPDAHHHVPLLLSPFGYSTYRGS
jgi:5-hydroxyisourate hydrolase